MATTSGLSMLIRRACLDDDTMSRIRNAKHILLAAGISQHDMQVVDITYDYKLTEALSLSQGPNLQWPLFMLNGKLIGGVAELEASIRNGSLGDISMESQHKAIEREKVLMEKELRNALARDERSQEASTLLHETQELELRLTQIWERMRIQKQLDATSSVSPGSPLPSHLQTPPRFPSPGPQSQSHSLSSPLSQLSSPLSSPSSTSSTPPSTPPDGGMYQSPLAYIPPLSPPPRPSSYVPVEQASPREQPLDPDSPAPFAPLGFQFPDNTSAFPLATFAHPANAAVPPVTSADSEPAAHPPPPQLQLGMISSALAPVETAVTSLASVISSFSSYWWPPIITTDPSSLPPSSSSSPIDVVQSTTTTPLEGPSFVGSSASSSSSSSGSGSGSGSGVPERVIGSSPELPLVTFAIIRTNWYWRRQHRVLAFGTQSYGRCVPGTMRIQEEYRYDDIREIQVTSEIGCIIRFLASEQAAEYYECAQLRELLEVVFTRTIQAFNLRIPLIYPDT